MVGVDVGFDNPLFACLELDYDEVDEDTTSDTVDSLTQTLTFYELDLGLNHVVRKESLELGQRGEFANKLIAVPGGGDGPSGTRGLQWKSNLVCISLAAVLQLTLLVPVSRFSSSQQVF